MENNRSLYDLYEEYEDLRYAVTHLLETHQSTIRYQLEDGVPSKETLLRLSDGAYYLNKVMTEKLESFGDELFNGIREDNKEASEETEEPKKEIYVYIQIEEMGFKKGVYTFVRVEEWADTDVVWNNDKLKQGNEVIDGDVFKCFEVESSPSEEEKEYVLVYENGGYRSKEVTIGEMNELAKKEKRVA
jgi:hypothetical protein